MTAPLNPYLPTVAPFRLFRLLFLFIFLLAVQAAVQAQTNFKYSKADLDLIQRTRLQETKADADYDRKAMLRIARVYERMYDRYKDTSMTAAIRCYRAACMTEGDLFDYQQDAAFAVAQIYERGKGTPRDTTEAIIFYYLAGKKGAPKMAQYKSYACNQVQWLNPSERAFTPDDSLVFSTSAFCSILKPEFRTQWKKVANLLRARPDLSVNITTTVNSDRISAPYNLLLREGTTRQAFSLSNFLVISEGIMENRIRFMNHQESDSDRLVIRFSKEEIMPDPPKPNLRRN